MVCTPNNPTGPTVRQDEFEEFMKAVPADVLVAVDEAYAEFVTDPEALQPFPLLDRYPNMVVLRTFSKAYGLAGLRVGYAVGRPRIISAIRAATTPFSVGSMAQMAAVLSLQMQDQMRQRVQQIVATRSVLADGLRAQGWEIPDPQGNFVWLDLGADAAAFAQAASNAGVIVRPFAGEGVRITVAEPESVERVLAVTETWI
jgi:histidinol-phosphate aminotransferase